MKNTTLPTKSQAWKHYRDTYGLHNLDLPRYYNHFDRFCNKILELWMFIPCKNGLPLEEPDRRLYSIHEIQEGLYKSDLEEYQKAKDKCLIKWNGTREQLDVILRENNTIGDLCEKFELTDLKFKELCL